MLFDVTWKTFDDDYLTSVPLVCESEWGTGVGGAGVNPGFYMTLRNCLLQERSVSS
jgi:hypothetical protein